MASGLDQGDDDYAYEIGEYLKEIQAKVIEECDEINLETFEFVERSPERPYIVLRPSAHQEYTN